jgi:hypothetical protein
LTSREAPGGDPPSTAAPAQAVDAARLQELRVARARELTRVQELAERLAQEEAEAEKLAWAHGRATERYEAESMAVARKVVAGQRLTYAQWGVLLGRGDRRLARQLAQDLAVKRAQVGATAQGLARAQSRVQELERALALAMARARTLAWERALARSPRLRAIAVGRLLWRLLQEGRSGLWDGIVRNLYLGMRVVGVLVWMLPTADRTRWRNQYYSELEDLKQEGAPLLGDAVRIALRTPWLALVLWTGAWQRSPAARWLPRLKPLWIGLGTAAAMFLSGAAGIGQSPTERQMRLLVAASMVSGLSGALAACQGSRGRWHRRRRRRRR